MSTDIPHSMKVQLNNYCGPHNSTCCSVDHQKADFLVAVLGGAREILSGDNIFMVSHNYYDIPLVEDLEKDDTTSIASDVFKNNIITVG